MDYLPIKIFNFVNLDAVFTNHFEYPAIILNFKGGGCHQHPLSYKIYSNQYFNHSDTKVLSVF